MYTHVECISLYTKKHHHLPSRSRHWDGATGLWQASCPQDTSAAEIWPALSREDVKLLGGLEHVAISIYFENNNPN